MQDSVARERADDGDAESPASGAPATGDAGAIGRPAQRSGCPYAGEFKAGAERPTRSSAAPFDGTELDKERPGWGARFIEYLAGYPHRGLRFLRWCTPALNIPIIRWTWVFRYEEVREVLSHDAEFPVPWTDKMKGLTSNVNFVLGMPRDKAPDRTYGNAYQQITAAFPLDDVPKYVMPLAEKETASILADKYDERAFDAIEEVITAVPTRMCDSYFGIPIPENETALFGKANLAISRYLFVPDTSAADKELAEGAAVVLSGKIRAAIINARSATNPKGGCPMTQLVAMGLGDAQIHAHMFGMVLGFLPTNVLAGGNILQTLLLKPAFMRACVRAARAGDDDLLWRCLREALRFRHINLGPWRECPNGYTLGAGGPRPIKIPPGNKVLAIMQTAMFDPKHIERPHRFDPDRPDEHYMVFGVGQHWCLGAYIAAAQLTQTFKLLLRDGKLEAVAGETGRMKRFSVYPLHLLVRLSK